MNVNRRSLIKEELGNLQKSYAEAFSVHGLTRIIYSGLKERVIWCLLFVAAVVGLTYMSIEIIEQFYHKDVRTEIRIEHKESQPWPTITICPRMTLFQHFTCMKNATLIDSVPSVNNISLIDVCSMHFRPPNVSERNENQQFETRKGCVVYNANGTMIHKGELKRGLQINYTDLNSQIPTKGQGIAVYFYDPQIAKNSSHPFYQQDFDFWTDLYPGNYEILLQTTEIEKLGPPYNSTCTNEKSINDKNNSKYSYKGCMDRCLAKKMKDNCGVVIDVFQDYVLTEDEVPLDQNETVRCLKSVLYEYIAKNTLNDCRCLQPCKQRVYRKTQRILEVNERKNWYLTIRFETNMVNVIREHPLRTVEELISQVGGSCGLFLGMSLLSLIEIFFHAVISLVKFFV